MFGYDPLGSVPRVSGYLNDARNNAQYSTSSSCVLVEGGRLIVKTIAQCRVSTKKKKEKYYDHPYPSPNYIYTGTRINYYCLV